MSGHSIAWTLHEDTLIRAVFTCHEPEGAPCREYCSGTCENGVTVCDGDCQEEGHSPRWDRHCSTCGTSIKPVPCIKIEWMVADGIDAEAYCGPTTSLRDGPIEFVWDLDHYDWRYVQ